MPKKIVMIELHVPNTTQDEIRFIKRCDRTCQAACAVGCACTSVIRGQDPCSSFLGGIIIGSFLGRVTGASIAAYNRYHSNN